MSKVKIFYIYKGVSMKNVLLSFFASTVAFASVSCLGQNPPTDIPSQIATIDKQLSDLKRQRDSAQMQALIAGRDADRFLTQDWLSYRRALARQEYFKEQVRLFDQKIAELEKQKAALQGKAK